MPITSFLEDAAFDPEAVRTMRIALEKACVRLGLSCEVSDPMTRLLALMIMDIARRGVSDPDTLCQTVLEEFNVSAKMGDGDAAAR